MKRVLLTLVTYGCGAAMVLTLVVPRATAQLPFPPDLPPAPGSLKNIKPPVPANLGQYIVDTNAAIVLCQVCKDHRQILVPAREPSLIRNSLADKCAKS